MNQENWIKINPDFAQAHQNQTYQEWWVATGLTKRDAQGWLAVGFEVADYKFIDWLKNYTEQFKEIISPSDFNNLTNSEKESLKEQCNNYSLICDSCSSKFLTKNGYFTSRQRKLDLCSPACYQGWEEEKNKWNFLHSGFYKENKYSNIYQWKNSGITYSQAVEWIKIGFEPEDYQSVRAWQGLASPAEVKVWLSQGLTKKKAGLVNYAKAKQLKSDANYNSGQLRKEFNVWKNNPPAQEYLAVYYPDQQQRSKITDLDISRQNLTGTLDLTDFVDLEYLSCHNNQITKLLLPTNNKLQSIYVSKNQLTNFPYVHCNPEALEELNLANNNLPATNIAVFSSFINLRELHIGNNNFWGSLQSLANCTKLKELDISNTNINSGWEHLPISLEYFIYSSRKDANCRVRVIEQEIREWVGDWSNLRAWKKQGFTGSEIKAWLSAGLTIDEFNLAVYYRTKNIEPNQIKEEGIPVQEWLDIIYPSAKRSRINKLKISKRNLIGQLDLSDFVDLEKLDCSCNKSLIHLNLSQNLKLKELIANNNQLKNIDFPLDLNQFNLERINIADNPRLNYVEIDRKFLKILPKLREKTIKKFNLLESNWEKNWMEKINNKNDQEKQYLYWQKEKEWNNSLNKITNEVKQDMKGEIWEPIYFETWWNPNCALIVNKVVKYAIRLVVVDNYPNYKVIRFPNNNPLSGYKPEEVQAKLTEIQTKLNSDYPILALEETGISPDELMTVERVYSRNDLQPTDLVWRNMKGMPGCYHVAVYLGDNKVAHIGSSKFIKASKIKEGKALLGARVDHWDDFKAEADKMFRYHPIIPFKRLELIQQQLTQAVLAEYGQKEYNFLGHNCEHFATLIVCGIPFSTQSEKLILPFKNWDLSKEIKISNQQFEAMISSEIFEQEVSKIVDYYWQQIKQLQAKTKLSQEEEQQLTDFENKLSELAELDNQNQLSAQIEQLTIKNN